MTSVPLCATRLFLPLFNKIPVILRLSVHLGPVARRLTAQAPQDFIRQGISTGFQVGKPLRVEKVHRIRIGWSEGDQLARLRAVAILSHEDQFIKQPIDIESGLVDGYHDNLAAIGQSAKRLHNQQRILRGKPLGGLVQKECERIGEQLHGQVDAFALAAADAFSFWRADEYVFAPLQAKLRDDCFDALVNFGVSIVRGQT